MNSYNSIILNENHKISILNKELPVEIIDNISQFMGTLYLCVYPNKLIMINIETQQIICIKLTLNITDAIYSFCGSKILCKTQDSIEQIDIKTHEIKQLYTDIIQSSITCMDIYNNNTVITNINNEIIVIKNNIIIFNKNVDYKILNCKFISENELIIVYNKQIFLYNIINNKKELLYEYQYNILYLTIYNNQLLVCFSNNKICYIRFDHYLTVLDIKLYNIKSNFEIKGAEFSGNNKYILLFGFESNLSIIKILDKLTMNEIAILNMNDRYNDLWIVSSNNSVIISESYIIINVWCLNTFKLLKTIPKFKKN